MTRNNVENRFQDSQGRITEGAASASMVAIGVAIAAVFAALRHYGQQ